MIPKIYNGKVSFLGLAIIFLITRILTYVLDIVPVGEELGLRWQLLPPALLNYDLLGSLYYLHYQPPIWNMIYGIMVKIFGTDYEVLSICIHLFNIFLSLISIYYFLLICKFFKLDKNKIYLTYFIFFIFSISFLYYETYTHYTHLTVLLFSQIVYFYLRFGEKKSLKYEILIYLISLILVYTWSAFSHPLFICVIFFGIFLIRFKENFFRSFMIFIISIFISIMPSIKNKIEFDIFANSTWIGMQIIQVLKAWDYYNLCGFIMKNKKEYEIKFKKENPDLEIVHPSLIGEFSGYNHIGYVYKTKKCLDIGINLIYQDPINFLKIVKFKFISSHGHFAFDHVGWDPIEWRKYFAFFYDINESKFSQVKVRFLQSYYLLIYLFFALLTIKNILSIHKENRIYQKTFSSIFLIYLWLITVIHVGAGFEQERMRHMGHFLHILFFIILIKNNFKIKIILKEFF